jgi:hypothetical protein
MKTTTDLQKAGGVSALIAAQQYPLRRVKKLMQKP